ncbi:hypothetical protein WME75_10705 [Sorangium sp. So ce1014]|uniref:hypothetical protein n=1 Tax=Sorangium sp. So ce1014 TaxID=3133326 RepID=UPI003F5D60E3
MADVQTDGQVTTDPKGGDVSAIDDQRLLNHVNAAVGSQLKRTLPKFLEEALGPHIVSLREQLQPKPEPKAAQPSGDPEVTRQLEELRAQLRKSEDSRARERQAAREEKAYGELRSELTGKVRPEAVDVVAKLLFHAEKRVTVDNHGHVSFKHGDTDYDLRQGVAEYLQSTESALFRPAPSPGVARKAPVVPARPVSASQRGEREDPLAKTLRDLGLA